MKASGLSSALLFWLASSHCLAEGAVRYIECDLTRVCDSTGDCKEFNKQTSHTAFTLKPQALDATGAGSWTITWNGREAGMTALGEAGPFYWTTDEGRERHTLVASSETRFLWHQLNLAAGPEATVSFMDCRLQG